MHDALLHDAAVARGLGLEARVFPTPDGSKANLVVTVPDADVEVLLLPAAAPWLRIADVVDQMRAIAATHTRPIHDGILSEDGKGVVDRVLSGLAEGVTDYRRLAPGEPWTF